MRASDRVYVNRSGENVSSPNTKEQLCEAVEMLTAQVDRLRAELATAREDGKREFAEYLLRMSAAIRTERSRDATR